MYSHEHRELARVRLENLVTYHQRNMLENRFNACGQITKFSELHCISDKATKGCFGKAKNLTPL